MIEMALFRRAQRRDHAPLPETKDSKVQRLIALTLSGRPQWTPRNYEALAREGFARNPVAYRCVRLIAEAAASVPLVVFEAGRRSPNHPLMRLLERPNPEQGLPDLLEAFFGALQTAGNGYLEAVQDDQGQPFELYALRSDRMKVVPGARGWPEAYDYSVGGRNVRLTRNGDGWMPVLHLKLLNPLNDYYGFSPLEAAAFAVDVHNASGAWNKALLDNAARPSGALVYGGGEGGERLTDEQFERLKAELTETHSGTGAAGRPLLLEGGLDWKPMSLSPADMDFIDGKHAAAREIALAFGVPPPLLGIPGDSTYANFKEANSAFWRHAVVPLTERLARALTGWLGAQFADVRIACDLDAVPALAPEREALWARLEAATFLTPQERRQMAGLGDGAVVKDTAP
jgi:HK97 family phage portal protein